MSIADYLEQGGVLTSPDNVPPRYRSALLRVMATFVDSELAGAAGFADMVNASPGTSERIAATRIVLEKTEHAERVLRIMREFGVNKEMYARSHPWTARLPRNAEIGAVRTEHDMRLAVFNYPLISWGDAVVMNLLMGLAVGIQMEDFRVISYQPLAEVFRQIAPREEHHAKLAQKGLQAMLAKNDKRDEIEASVAYWWPRVGASFGADDGSSDRAQRLQSMGIRHVSGTSQRAQWIALAAKTLTALSIDPPE